MALANLIGTYTAGLDAIAQDINTDLNSLLTRVNSVTTEQMAAGSVVESILAAASVSTAKIQDGALTADATGRAKMADGFTTFAKLDASARFHLLHAQVTTTSAVGAGSSATSYTKRSVTQTFNEISGASISSGVITLPVGTYYVEGYGTVQVGVNGHAIRFIGTTAGVVARGSGFSQADNAQNVPVPFAGRFTIAAPDTFEIQQDAGVAVADGWGKASSVDTNVYVDVRVWKLPSS